MGKWLKKLSKVFGVIVGILVLLVLLAVLFLQTGPGKDFLRARIDSALEGALAGEVEIGRIEGGLLGAVEVYDVVVRDARGNVAARVPHASADYDLLQLLESELHLESVSVERPLVIGRVYDDGTLNLGTIPSDEPTPKQAPSQFQISLDQATIDGGLIVWINDQQLQQTQAGPDSEELTAGLEEWLAAVNRGEATTEELQVQIGEILSQTPSQDQPGGPLAVAALGGLELRGSYYSYGGAQMSGQLESLSAKAWTDATSQPQDVAVEDLSFQRSAPYLEATLETLRVGSLASVRELSTGVEFRTVTDELGNRAVVGLDEFIAEIGRAQVDEVFVHLFAPDAPITGQVSASARVGGTLDELAYLLRVGCGDEPTTTLAGTASLPGQDLSGATYDLAARFDDLSPSRCIDIGGTQASLSGALVAEGSGTNPETLEANARLALTGAQVDEYRIDSAYLDTSADDGVFRIDQFEVLTPYAQAALEGRFGLDGEYRVQLDIDANEQIRQLAEQLGQQQLTSEFAQVRLLSEGQLDLEADSPLGYVERGELSLGWQLRDFSLEEYRVGSSRGDVFARISPASDAPQGSQAPDAPESARFVEFNADLQAQSVDTPQLKAQRLSVDAQGQGVLAVPVDDLLEALRGLSSTWDVKVRQLRAGDTRIGRADIRAAVDRGGPGRPFQWNAEGTVSSARVGNNRLGGATFDLEGTAQVDQTDKGPQLGPISAKGTASVRDLKAGQNRVAQGQVRVDVRGEVPDLKGSVDLEATGVQAAGETFESIEAEVQIDEDRQFEVSARAQRGDDKAPISLEAAGKAGADFQDFQFERFKLESPDMELTLPEGARVKVTEDGVTFDKMRLQTNGQSISVEGTFRSKGRQDLRVEFDNVQIGKIRERFDLQEIIPPVQATVTGEVSIQGTARRPIIAIELHLRDVYYEDYGPFSADLVAQYENQRLRIVDFSASAYDTQVLAATGEMPLDLNLSGDISVPQTSDFDMQVRVPRIALQDFYGPVPVLEQYAVGGSVFANLHVAGTVRSPRLTLQLEGKDLAFAGDVGEEYLEIQDVSTALKADYSPPSGGQGGISGRYRLSWQGDQLVEARMSTPMPLADWIRRVLDEDAAPPDWASAVAQLPFDLKFELADLNLDRVPLESFNNAAAAGTVSLDLTGQGTFSDPQLDLDFSVVGFRWDTYQDISVWADLRLRDQMVHIDELRSQWNADEVISAEGKFPLPTEAILNGERLTDFPIDLTLELAPYPLSRLSTIDYQTFSGYKGTLAAYAKITGTLSDPTVEGRAGLFDTEFSDGRMGTLGLSFSAEDGRANVDTFVCRAYDEVMTATASMPITTNILALTEGASFLEEGEIRAEISSERIHVGQLIPKSLTGGPNAEPEEQFIADPEGLIEIDAEVSGTWEQPQVRGQLIVKDGAVTIPSYARRFTGIEIDVEATQERIQLETLQVFEGESWVRAEGTIALDKLQPTTVDAVVRSQEFNFGGFADGFAAYVDSTIEIDGDLSGEVQRIRAHATKLEVTVPEGEGGNLYPTSLDNEIVVLERRTDAEDVLDLDNLLSQPEEEPQQQTPMEIRFIADRGSWVRHPVADVEFTADFTTSLIGDRISMLGSVDTVRGNASLLGKEFEVPEHENAVRFTGASPPNPALDIEALNYLDRSLTDSIGEPAEGQPRIIVRVRGRADNPQLVLESDPAMTETEIIYVLMTGRAPNQAGVGEESRMSGMALGAASGLFAGLLQERLSGTLPLDVVRLRPGEEGFADARVEVGKYITQDIFVSYILRLGAEEGEGINVISVDYHFAPSWSLEFQTSDALTGGVNIFWDVY
jgi:translocation and assembly module TamB